MTKSLLATVGRRRLDDDFVRGRPIAGCRSRFLSTSRTCLLPSTIRGLPSVPTVFVVGRPDRKVEPVRKTKGITLDGVRLTETLLSESVLILRPDGTGSWGYHAGFDIFREPEFRDGQRIDPRTLVEYDKWRYDPLEPVTVVGGDINLLRLYHQRPYPPAFYIAAASTT